MTTYTITDRFINGFAVIEVTEGKFKGIKYIYGALKLEEDVKKGEAYFQFEYQVVDGDITSDVKEFEKLISEILNDMVFNQLNKNAVIYAGGVDE